MRLLIADDHTLFRDALIQYIERAEPEAKVTLAKDLYEVFDILKKDTNFDLVLLDLKMPGMSGMLGFEKVIKEYPDLRIALMSGIAETDDVKKSMELGSVGFFPKTLSGKALLKAIQLVLAGERFLPIDHKTSNIQASYYNGDNERASGISEILNGGRKISADMVKLTPREHDVLSYLAKGASNKEIARDLDLQVVTIKLHVRGICRKLGAQNRTQAALKAKEMGIV